MPKGYMSKMGKPVKKKKKKKKKKKDDDDDDKKRDLAIPLPEKNAIYRRLMGDEYYEYPEVEV